MPWLEIANSSLSTRSGALDLTIHHMSKSSGIVSFLYGTTLGRLILKCILSSQIDRLAADFLWTKYSKPLIGGYAKQHNISVEKGREFISFRDFFVRTRPHMPIDLEPDHLICPCDGWLSAYPIRADSSFAIKGSYYQLKDLLQNKELSENYHDGICLIFRLCASDYHHYCYIDDGYQGENHYIPGILHSVQPIACEKTYPVYTLNRRVWTLLATEHFGPVIQTEIGALVVGGIFNEREKPRFWKGMEMGHFELAGSTIMLLFEKGHIQLLPDLVQALSDDGEVRVRQGMWIGNQMCAQRGQA